MSSSASRMVEAVILPDSLATGRRLARLELEGRYDVRVLGLQR